MLRLGCKVDKCNGKKSVLIYTCVSVNAHKDLKRPSDPFYNYRQAWADDRHGC